MKKVRWRRFLRKSHRYLAVIFGIQFLFWTLGGLYFSWTNIKQIRGEDLRKENAPLNLPDRVVPVTDVVAAIKAQDTLHGVEAVQLVAILGKPYYQVSYHGRHGKQIQLADAATGALRGPLTQVEAIAVAKDCLKDTGTVAEVAYLTQANGHHEYREKPLPAYAVQFTGKVNTTVYVSANLGTVQSLRNNRWRVFDFLWMLHTMDYSGRDNINNWALRIFSVWGLVTIVSGFVLYFTSLKRKRKRQIFKQTKSE